jgi:hypothetical protein
MNDLQILLSGIETYQLKSAKQEEIILSGKSR